MNARFKSAVVTGHTAFPGNLVFGPETTALAPPTGDFHIHAAADTLNIVFPGFLDFEQFILAVIRSELLYPKRLVFKSDHLYTKALENATIKEALKLD